MTKAYLSNERCRCCSCAPGIPDKLAVQEAERILAEVEPRSTTDHVNVRLLDPRGRVALSLKDALHGFVGGIVVAEAEDRRTP